MKWKCKVKQKRRAGTDSSAGPEACLDGTLAVEHKDDGKAARSLTEMIAGVHHWHHRGELAPFAVK